MKQVSPRPLSGCSMVLAKPVCAEACRQSSRRGSVKHPGRGKVLLVGALAGFAPGPGAAAYHATKAYVHSLGDRKLGAPSPTRGASKTAGGDRALMPKGRKPMSLHRSPISEDL